MIVVSTMNRTMPNGSTNSSSSNTFLLPKNDLTMVDSQLIDVLLHGPSTENKIQVVNRWCKNPRRNRLSNILDVSQRHDALLSLVNTLQQTTNTEYQFNCLTLLSEIQTNIQHYDQTTYLPAIIHCFSSTSNDVQILTSQILIKQIHTTNDIPTFLHIYTHEGLRSSNIRVCVKSIEILNDLLTRAHQHEDISPIFEILLQRLQDNQFRSNYNQILLRAIDHFRRILTAELLNAYLDSYSPALKRLYHTYVPQQISKEHDDETDQTPRATVKVTHVKENNNYSLTGSGGYRSNGTNHSENSYSIQKITASETSDIYTLLETIRSKWMTSTETNRLNYLDRLKMACDKHLQTIHSQYSSKTDTQLYQTLHAFFTSVLELLFYITTSNLEFPIRIKLILSTCLGWIVKHSQGTYCKKNYKNICTVFKNILLNGQSNNRQLAKFSVSLILLLETFVHPQWILNELIDSQFQYYNYRIQLELLAITTATFIKHRQYHYENLLNTYKYLLPMLTSNRRELRHGAMECFTVMCTYYNSFKPITSTSFESNESIKLMLKLIETTSLDASNALRFRLQRNILPSLTDEGNITPGLVCDTTTSNDPDAKFILLVSGNNNNTNNNNNNSSAVHTPQSSASHEATSMTSSSTRPTTNKLLQLAMPFATKKPNTQDKVMRSREIPPLKPPDAEHDAHRYGNTNHNNTYHYENSLNRQQRHQLNRRLNLSTKRQISIATVATSGTSAAGPPFDFTVTSNTYRPSNFTEKVFADDWAKKLPTNNQRKEPLSTVQPPENNTLQFRPAIPRRSSVSRLPASHHPLVTSQIHNHHEPKYSGRRFDSDVDQDTGTDSAIESHSLSNNPGRSVHSSSTRRKADRLFSNGSDLESTSARTLTPERSNESGVYSQSTRNTDHHTNGANRSIKQDQLFSTKPRLARSGSKTKLESSQSPPSDPSSGQAHDLDKIPRLTNSYVEIVGRGYADEKSPNRRQPNEHPDDKQVLMNKPRAKILKGSLVTNPANNNPTVEDVSNMDDENDIGVVGKAVNIPTRNDVNRMQNINNKMNQENDNTDTMSDEFDSDSKENDNVVTMSQSLSASFRLRIQQKTQEKIEQKERRRQDRENRILQKQQQQQLNNNSDIVYDNDTAISSTSTSRYSSQPDLAAMVNDRPTTPRRQVESNINSILPNFPSQQRFRPFKNSMSRSQTFNNRRDTPGSDQQLVTSNRPSSEDRTADQVRNPYSAYREAMESIANEDWQQKCSGLSLIQLLVAQYPDTITQNLHQVVLILIQEVKNLRSQVARFALSTFCEMFKHLKRNMDIELDLTVKALIQKSADSNEFFRSDTEKCLQTMIENVTLQKALQALIAGGASHRNPAARKTSAKYIYHVCEKLGPTKILSGTRDITDRVLQVAATFASDGPPEIRWYGKKIYHMLMTYDELDSMMKHYLTPAAYTNMCEILDNIRAKGGVGETPSESARNNGRRTLSNDKLISNGSLSSQFSSTRKINNADQAEQVRELTKQMRSSDFRERLNGIEEFQKLCELETDTAIQCLVQIFDGFNECLADMNSKVVLRALNTMHQLVPILGDALSSVINSALPLVAQNIASKNREISQLASDIIDTTIEYIDCGVLIQPLCILSQNSNLRVRPDIILKLAALVPQVCQRKPKQVEIHLLPTYWKLLALLRGQTSMAISSSAGGSNSLNASIHVLTTALYTELGSVLIDRASVSSSVTPKNLQLLRELCTSIDAV